ncbi:MAG: hypothetical protein J2O49_08105, partial [Sciscionella sp.]|nr:hypothetical protein [Sciscionella sp.]
MTVVARPEIPCVLRTPSANTRGVGIGAESTPTVTVAVIGLGYVGLPTALSLAEHDTDVIGVDISADRLRAIRDGRADLLERDRVRLADQLAAQRLRMTTDPSALAGADAVLVCVPTPVDEHLAPDLGPLRAAC